MATLNPARITPFTRAEVPVAGKSTRAGFSFFRRSVAKAPNRSVRAPVPGPLNTGLPLISIGIPAFNRPELLREALASIAAQTDFDDFEVVVCDDLGLPDTRAVVESSSLPRIRLHTNPHPLGAVGNWNRCLEMGRGHWMTILHEDDTLYPWYFATVVPRLRASLSAISMKCISGSDPSIPRVPSNAGKIRIYHSSCFIKSAMTPFPGVLFPRTLALQLRGFDERWGPLADYDFWYRLACSGEVETLGSVGAFYRESPCQWTCSVWPEMLRKNHLLRLKVARDQFPRNPQLGRWLARFFTYRNARSYSQRFPEHPLILTRTLKFGGWLQRALPSGWAWLLVQRLATSHAITAC